MEATAAKAKDGREREKLDAMFRLCGFGPNGDSSWSLGLGSIGAVVIRAGENRWNWVGYNGVHLLVGQAGLPNPEMAAARARDWFERFEHTV